MPPFPPLCAFDSLIDLARGEDLGPTGDDVTSRLSINESAIGVGTLLQKQAGVVCGLPIVEHVCRAYDQRLRVEFSPGDPSKSIEGRYSDPKALPLLWVHGPLRSLLAAERVLLNFVQHLSGVATMAHEFVRRVEGTHVRICDTRKTTPGFRALDKYAVAVGGAVNHRTGLFDMLLIKDNHIAGVAAHDLSTALEKIVSAARREPMKRLIEVEVDTLEQLAEVLKVDGIDYVLLDNMDCPTMAQAVAMRNAAGKQNCVQLEASGGVSLETVRSIALTGVDRISVGSITHSAPALDIGLDVVPL